MNELQGLEAQKLLSDQLNAALNGISDVLAPFEPTSALHNFANTFRAIEEFINLPMFGIDDESLKRDLINLRLDNPDPLRLVSIRDRLFKNSHKEVANRIIVLIVQASAMFSGFAMQGIHEAAAGLQTVGHAIGYFQSRRRHLLAILYSIPTACKGSRPLVALDTLNVILPLAEMSGIPITSNHNMLMLCLLHSDFKVFATDKGYTCSHFYNVLDSSFLEPERVPITEMEKLMADKSFLKNLEKKPRGKLFSAAELRNDIKVIAAAYSEFDLANSPAYMSVANFVTACSRLCEDDYYVKISETKLEAMIIEHAIPAATKKLLTQNGDDYVANLNSYAPFVSVGGNYFSTVTLLSRFMHQWKILVLNRVKRFQIRSGFILEDSVKRELMKQEYFVTDIKRINGSEFDVVATMDGIIYNIQCKNNLIDFSRIEVNPKLFVRYNRQLDRYYTQALKKEESRENLLKTKLQLNQVVHVIVSRFPIATTNPRVIPFSKISRFKEIIAQQI
ncbi:MAG: hypothetical protein WA071_12370 [Undibacterium umbellatum]|uniref:hypothetical protein n=1 Tax=Undibacterium umbellatum TaxID=2762300 RepID=UPI003BB717C8